MHFVLFMGCDSNVMSVVSWHETTDTAWDFAHWMLFLMFLVHLKNFWYCESKFGWIWANWALLCECPCT